MKKDVRELLGPISKFDESTSSKINELKKVGSSKLFIFYIVINFITILCSVATSIISSLNIIPDINKDLGIIILSSISEVIFPIIIVAILIELFRYFVGKSKSKLISIIDLIKNIVKFINVLMLILYITLVLCLAFIYAIYNLEGEAFIKYFPIFDLDNFIISFIVSIFMLIAHLIIMISSSSTFRRIKGIIYKNNKSGMMTCVNVLVLMLFLNSILNIIFSVTFTCSFTEFIISNYYLSIPSLAFSLIGLIVESILLIRMKNILIDDII